MFCDVDICEYSAMHIHSSSVRLRGNCINTRRVCLESFALSFLRLPAEAEVLTEPYESLSFFFHCL